MQKDQRSMQSLKATNLPLPVPFVDVLQARSRARRAHSNRQPAAMTDSEVEALGWRYVSPMSDDTIELEARLYEMHPGRHLIPFYLWLAIRGYGQFDASFK